MSRRGIVLALALAACGVSVGPNGSDVGARCEVTQIPFPCDEQCITGSVPGNICSYRCLSDADCPNGSACVDRQLLGGVYMCLEVCESDARCAEYGRGLRCVRRSRIGASGTVPVCWLEASAP